MSTPHPIVTREAWNAARRELLLQEKQFTQLRDQLSQRRRALRLALGARGPMRSDLPGISVFAKDAQGGVFHTYSCYARGIDMMNAAYHYLDLVPKGRDEADGPMKWLRRRDEYQTGEAPSCARSV